MAFDRQRPRPLSPQPRRAITSNYRSEARHSLHCSSFRLVILSSNYGWRMPATAALHFLAPYCRRNCLCSASRLPTKLRGHLSSHTQASDSYPIWLIWTNLACQQLNRWRLTLRPRSACSSESSVRLDFARLMTLKLQGTGLFGSSHAVPELRTCWIDVMAHISLYL